MCPLKGFQRVPLPCLPAICQPFSPFLSFHFSLFSAFLLFLWDHVSVALVVFYPFHCNLPLSPIKPNANPVPLPSCFPLAWPGLAWRHLAISPGFSPALHASPQLSGPLNTFIISRLLLSCIISPSFLPWSGTVELSVTCSLQLWLCWTPRPAW